jgi:hypothetical protein
MRNQHYVNIHSFRLSIILFVTVLTAMFNGSLSAQTTTINYSGSIVTYTVPAGVFSLSIDSRGAEGGLQLEANTSNPGKGARVSGIINVTPGQQLNILVGGQGVTAAIDEGAGGGGGTFITTSSNTPLLVAGGGGGEGADANGVDASITNNGTAANTGGPGGINGNGGNINTTGTSNGSGGGGFFTDGADACAVGKGRAFVNGGAGGLSCGGGGSAGGFGGGGGGSAEGGGGGGGYSGGGGADSGTDGGGGGASFNSGITLASTSPFQSGNGQVIITILSACIAPTNQPTSLILTPAASFQINGSFTAASGSDSYLIVRYPAGASPSQLPNNGTIYSAGVALGNGTVVTSTTSTTFTATGLVLSTSYDFYVYSMNSICSGGPLYLTSSPLNGTATTPAGSSASLNGGLWSSPATWLAGSVPPVTETVIIPAGAIVTVDQLVTAANINLSGQLQWNGSSNAMTITGNLIINPGGKFLPYTTGLTGQTINIGGNFTNNGYANFALASTFLNFNGGGSVLNGSGVFQGDGIKGIIRTLAFQNSGSNAISTAQNLAITTEFRLTAGSLNTNGKLTIDNTAQVYGQALNTQVASVAVTVMGSAYSVAPVVFGGTITQWTNITGVVGTRYVSGTNVYVCITAANIGPAAPVHTSGISQNLLWIGTVGTIGNPCIFNTTVAVGTQYFYGNNLYVCTISGTPNSAAPPTHLSGLAISGTATFLYVGSPATVSVNYDAVTQTVRSLSLTNTGTGLSSAPSINFSVGVAGGTGSGATATAVYIQLIAGPANALTQKSGIAVITGGLNINSDQGASIASTDTQSSSGVGAISTSGGGVNYSIAPQIAFGGPLALNLISNTGSGYTAVPTITVTGGTLIAGSAYTSASFTITVNQGVVESVYLTSTAAVYSVPPTLTMSAPTSGTTAQLSFPAGCWPSATATIGTNGQILNFNVINSGYGYATAPLVAFGPTSGTAAGGTFTTAATTPTSRIALYNLTLSLISPATTAVANSDDAVIPANRKMNNLALAGNGNGLNLTNNLTLFGTAPFTLTASSSLPGNVLNLGGNNLNFTWNGYAGASSTFGTTNVYIKNGSMTLTGRGGGSTFNYPFSGTFIWFAGSGTTTLGNTATRVTVTETAAPSGVASPAGTAAGTRAFRVTANMGSLGTAVFGTTPTVTMNFNSTDVLSMTQQFLSIGEASSLSGAYIVRSTAFGASGSLPTTGSKITATIAPGPISPSGDNYYAWINTAAIPTVTSFSPSNFCQGGGETVSISGSAFTGTTAVKFNGVDASSFVVNNDNSISAITPAGISAGIIAITSNGVTGTSSAYTVSATGLLTSTQTPANGLICSIGASVDITLNNIGANSYTWTGAGLNTNSGLTVTASPATTTQYTVTAAFTSLGCNVIKRFNIGVIAGTAVTPTANPTSTCFPGGSSTVQLNSNLSAGNFGVSSIPYGSITPPSSGVTTLINNGTVTVPLSGGSTDDGGWSGIPIGFTYNFFGTNFTSIAASTNATLKFGPVSCYTSAAGCLGFFSFVPFPSATNPDNVIALMATDLTDIGASSTVKYWNDGIAPTRRFIIQYNAIPFCCSSTNPTITATCILYETTGVVEIFIANASNDGTHNKFVALQNTGGAIGAAAPGRNGGLWSATNEAWRFSPPSNYTYQWSPSTGLNSTTGSTANYSVTAAGTFNYMLTVTNPTTGCVTDAAVSFNVLASPNQPAITGNLNVCGLATTTLTSNNPAAGNTINWYDAPVAGNLLFTGTSFTTPILNASKTYYIQETTPSCSSLRTAVTVNWTAPPNFAIYNTTNNNTASVSFCGTSSVPAVNLDAGFASASSWDANGSTYSWSQSHAGGLSCAGTCSASNTVDLNNILPAFNNEHIVVTVTNPVNGCISSASVDVTAFTFPGFNATATPPSICTGQSTVLSAGLSASNFSVSSIPFTGMPVPAGGVTTLCQAGSITTPMTTSSLDDGIWGSQPIGFNFNFFGNTYSTVNISTNGNLQFSSNLTTYTPGSLPTTSVTNFVAPFWTDLYPALPTSPGFGIIRHWVSGFTPNRIFVVEYNNVGHYNLGSTPVAYYSGQVWLYETTGVVEVHISSINNNLSTGYTWSTGVNNATGSVGAAAPNRNNNETGAFLEASNEGWRFSPPVNYTFSWSSTPSGFSSTTGDNTISPAVTTSYNVLITDPITGCTKSDNITVAVNSLPNVAVSSSSPSVCYPGGTAATLTASGNAATYNWSPTTGLSGSSGSSVTALPATSTIYTVTGTSAFGCTSSAPININVIPAPVLTITSTPSSICSGSNAQLNAVAISPGYTMNTNCSSGFIDIGTSGTSLGLLDDDGEYNITTPSITFNGIAYTSARIGTNGVIVLGSNSGDITNGNTTLPSTANTAGNILLAPYWDDLDIDLGGTIRTQTVGSVYIIQFTGINHFSFTTGTITFQVQINLVSGVISYIYQDVIFGNSTYDSGINATIGIQFSASNAVQYSYLTASLTNGQCISFSPNVPSITYDWSANSNFLSSTSIANPLAQGVTSSQVYSLSITDQNTGCSQTQTYNLNVNPLPDPQGSSNTPVCDGQDLFFFSASGNTYYQWAGPNGFSANAANPVLNGATLSATGVYTISVTDNNGCIGTQTVDVTVNENPTVVLTVTPVSCDGFNDGSVVIDVNNNDQNGFYFISDDNGNFQFINPVTFTDYYAGTYNYLVQDQNSCSSSGPIVIPTVPNAAPIISCPGNISLNAAAGVCGTTVTYATPIGTDVCPVVGTVQTAGLPSGSVFPVGTTTNTFVVTDASGLTATCSFNVTVTDNVAPVVANCPASFSACNPITWTPPSFTDNCAGVQVVSSHTPGTIFPPGTTTVTYTATDVYNNQTVCSFNVTVVTPSVAADTITSNRDYNNICLGENITLTIGGGSLGALAQWKWYAGSCGGTVVGTGSTLTVTPTVTTTYYARAEGQCNTTACKSITVVVSSGATVVNPVITSTPAYGAPGTTATVTCNLVPGATFYRWTSNYGQINGMLFNGQVGPVETTIPSVQVTFVLPQSNYQIRLVVGNACGRSNTASAQIRGTVGAPTSITGPTQVCPLQTATYTVSAIPDAASYNWVLIPANAGTISGTGLSRTITFAAGFTSAQLCVNGVSNFNLAGPAYCINISTNAPAPGLISGNAQPCSGGSATYTIAAVANATGYNWTTSVPGATVSASGTSATVTYPAGTFSGNVCVTSTSTCGVSAPSCLAVTSGTPGTPGPITGPVQGICNANGVNYALATSNALSYSWSTPTGVTVASGGASNSVNLNFGAGFTTGTITVTATYSCGSASSSITVNGAPSVPSVTPTTICPGGDAVYFASSVGGSIYNWTISGADYDNCTNPPSCSQYYIYWSVSGGSFSVTSSNSCGISAPLSVSTNCRISSGTEPIDSKVYPNPTSGMLMVEFTSSTSANFEIQVSDLTGRTVLAENVKATQGINQHEVNLTSFNKGIYMLTLKDENGNTKVTRVAVQ